MANARKAVERIVEKSELRDLWEESESYDAWRADVANLRERLGPASKPKAKAKPKPRPKPKPKGRR